ncbi:hypothetical protein KIH27_21370 [Mycobacterium sp. M1]|uniref:PPE family domain-containing protein n=1 Tax=Mycolicibacter acidiphilus TaxID=2835306 RepID=A0ABS5RRI3_9MYCO|nr:hypothetical protein [Mycolicibacter acidiphilus]MBS9536138.1 hypothetical protein [Mycolicibacter acidiphilus]
MTKLHHFIDRVRLEERLNHQPRLTKQGWADFTKEIEEITGGMRQVVREAEADGQAHKRATEALAEKWRSLTVDASGGETPKGEQPGGANKPEGDGKGNDGKPEEKKDNEKKDDEKKDDEKKDNPPPAPENPPVPPAAPAAPAEPPVPALGAGLPGLGGGMPGMGGGFPGMGGMPSLGGGGMPFSDLGALSGLARQADQLGLHDDTDGKDDAKQVKLEQPGNGENGAGGAGSAAGTPVVNGTENGAGNAGGGEGGTAGGEHAGDGGQLVDAKSTQVQLPNGDLVEARNGIGARALRAMLDGASVSEAYRQAQVTLPPPGTPVTEPVPPAQLKAGDVGMWKDHMVPSLGGGKVLVSGQVQPLESVGSGPDFLGWFDPTAAAVRGAQHTV